VPLRIKKEATQMAMTEEQKAKFAAKKAATAIKAPSEHEPEEAKSEETDSEEKEETEAAPAAPKAVTPKPVNAAKVKAPEGSTAATVAALAGELAAIDKSRDQVLAKIRAAVA
jgi:hypothetical protein